MVDVALGYGMGPGGFYSEADRSGPYTIDSAGNAQLIGAAPNLKPLGYQQLALSSSPQKLSPPAGAVRAAVTVEGAGMRWRTDGTAPTASVGVPVAAGATVTFNASVIAVVQLVPAGRGLDRERRLRGLNEETVPIPLRVTRLPGSGLPVWMAAGRSRTRDDEPVAANLLITENDHTCPINTTRAAIITPTTGSSGSPSLGGLPSSTLERCSWPLGLSWP